MSSPRFTIVVRSASRNTSRSSIDTSSSATNESIVSATETRTPRLAQQVREVDELPLHVRPPLPLVQ